MFQLFGIPYSAHSPYWANGWLRGLAMRKCSNRVYTLVKVEKPRIPLKTSRFEK